MKLAARTTAVIIKNRGFLSVGGGNGLSVLLWQQRCFSRSKLPEKERLKSRFIFPVANNSVKTVSKNLDQYLGKKDGKVVLNGHIHRKPRIMATKAFVELRDSDGDVVQLLVEPELVGRETYEEVRKVVVEESVSCSGHVQLKQMRKGLEERQWELVVKEFQVLNQSNLDAAKLDKLKHSSPRDLPPHFRYLQLRTPFFQQALRMRSKIAVLVRNTLSDKHDFVEIETPLLFKSTPEGAREFLVPTRTPDMFYALPQSPQQYKQILMSSGFTRYFQIAKCFRDEDLRSDRQPEFTQIDIEMGFINDSDQVAMVIEDLVHSTWSKIGNLPTYLVNEQGFLREVQFDINDSPSVKFSKLKYKDALALYGIDKPNMKYSIFNINLSRSFTPLNTPEPFSIVEACVLKGAFDPKKPFKIPNVLTDPKSYLRRKPIIIKIDSEDTANNWFKHFIDKGFFREASNFDQSKLGNLLSLKPGDILAVSTRAELPFENPTPLGKFRQLVIDQYPNKWKRKLYNKATGKYIDDYDAEKVFVGTWVVEFPLFNPVEIGENLSDPFPKYDFHKFESTHHPFTAPNVADYDLLEKNPLLVRGEHYDLVINGVEVGGGSRRIHVPELQRYIFESILKIKDHENIFGHLLHALSMGCPPHAGFAIGFDRLCAMIAGTSSIKDIIAFPKNQSGVDPVVNSPSPVSEDVLNEYYITNLKKH